MSWTMPDWFARVPRVVRVLIAVPLALMLTFMLPCLAHATAGLLAAFECV